MHPGYCPHCYANEGFQHQGWCPTQLNLARASQRAQAGFNPDRQEIRWNYPRIAEAADLGIVDELLDDKVGMDL